jgi:hypothetical protein
MDKQEVIAIASCSVLKSFLPIPRKTFFAASVSALRSHSLLSSHSPPWGGVRGGAHSFIVEKNFDAIAYIDYKPPFRFLKPEGWRKSNLMEQLSAGRFY